MIKGGPHCIMWTHADEVNAELLAFIKESREMLGGTAKLR